MARAGPVILLLLAAIVQAGPEAVKGRVEALKKSELKRLEIHLAAQGALVPAVRIERISEIRTFLSHLEEAAWRRVLILGEPAPAIARVVVTRQEGAGLELDVTRRAFRVADGPGAAWVFQSPALLRWLEDRLERPQYALRKDLPALREAFVKETSALTREADAGAGEAPAERETGGPLIRNGGFEEGEGSPQGWDPLDHLTTFRVADPFPGPAGKKHGLVLKMDTDVLESEWLKRKQELAADPQAKPWPKTLVEPQQQYQTVGATYGVSYYSAPIPIRKGQAYRITVDFRAGAPDGGISKIWVRGYGKVEVRGQQEWRRIYDSLHTLRTDDPTWHTYTNVFHPTKNTPRAERVRIMLYSYWPRGEYRWDNVVLEPIDAEEYRRAKQTERSDVK